MSESLRNAARQARHAALAGVRAIGGFDRVAASEWRRRRLLILCYHGVSLQDEHEWTGGLFMAPAFLRRRFEILREHKYAVLPLGDAIRGMQRGTLPARSVVLTFDDGFHDFSSAAAPLLEEFGYPATNYMSTYYCLHQNPLPMVTLRYLLWCARSKTLDAGALPGQDAPLDLGDARARDGLAARLLNPLRERHASRQAQHDLVGEVATRLELDWEQILRGRMFHLMTAAEVTDVVRRGFDVQLHTHRHRTPRDKDAFCDEVAENRRILRELTGRAANHFCYPSGDVDPMFLPWLREMGVETATTTSVAGMAGAEREPLLLPRYVDTMAKSEILFESWLSGVGAIMSRKSA